MATTTAVLPRQSPLAGILEWVFTTDHKKIGILYIVTGFTYFIVAGIFALVMRSQLAFPNGNVLTNYQYNEIFTMHATTMIFLVVMPISVGLGNYLVPLQIGARDMAFPRLNALSYWLLFFGGLFLYSSFLFGGAPDKGWFSYAGIAEQPFSA